MKNLVNKLFWPIILLLITLLVAATTLFVQYRRLDQQNRSNLISYLNTVRASLDTQLIASFAGDESDLQNPQYLNFRQQLIRLADTYSQARYLYLMRLDGNQVKFIIDIQASNVKSAPNLATPGEVYPEAKNSLLQLFSHDDIITVGPESDSWGTFVSGLASVTSADGQIIGIIGVDVNSTDWNRQIINQLVYFVVIFIILYFLELLIYILTVSSREHQNTLSYLANVLDYSYDSIVSYDLNGVVKSWNRGSTKIFGYTEAEALGKSITDLIYPEDKKSEFNLIVSSAQLGQNILQRQTIRQDKSGKLHQVLVTESPVYYNDQIVSVSIVSKDITADAQSRQKLVDRNAQLEKLNSLLVNRELVMIDLKKKIKKQAARK